MNTIKKTIKLIKEALKHRHLYSKTEVYYMKNALKEAKQKLKSSKSVKSLKKNESTTNNSNS